MFLAEIKEALSHTECGEFLREGIGCSEPLPIPIPNGFLDNCFLYMYDNDANVYSAPVARVGFIADQRKIVYFISCYDKPFSMRPETIIEAAEATEKRLNRYARYEELYNSARALFYKENCDLAEKTLLLEFADTFEAYVDEPQRLFYREMLPPFFAWLSEQVSEACDEDTQTLVT